jgi:hypothetical protein
MPVPNPHSKSKIFPIVALVGVVALVVSLVAVALLIRSVIASGITKGPDNMFGDQWEGRWESGRLPA